MRDDLLQPAFAIYNSPGVYALLLGSGASRSAEIMTGWDIMKDLINQIAAALGETIEGDPEKWYKEKFKNEAGYDHLLEHLGRTPLDRNAILRDYIEPSAEDREEERKLPTPAHKAIAWLVEKGYVRVILTTNFDRLIETALQERGIVPDIISTDTDIASARPLQHSPITIIKIHGDYRDEITKNTKTELAEYSDAMKQLLQRVFSEYGLVVSGWSGDWDAALRTIIENAKSKYATYWSWYSEPTEVTNQLITSRKAYPISSIGADTLFDELQKMVEALEGTKRQPPLNIDVAVEQTKRMLLRPELQINLDELLQNVAEEAVINALRYNFKTPVDNVKQELFEAYKQVELALYVFATLCFYDKKTHIDQVEKAISYWMERLHERNIPPLYRDIPVISLIFTCGISALYKNNWNYLKAALILPKYNRRHNRKSIFNEMMQSIYSSTDTQFAENRVIRFQYDALKSIFLRFNPSEELFDDIFELFCLLTRLIYLDNQPNVREFWISEMPYRTPRGYLSDFFVEGVKFRAEWDFLKAGFFDGSTAKLQNALLKYVEISKKLNRLFPEQNVDYAALYRWTILG